MSTRPTLQSKLFFLAIVFGMAFCLGEAFGATNKPAVFIHARSGARYSEVDLTYLKELHDAGFEVDYTNEHGEFTWERVKRYNTIIIYNCPQGEEEKSSHLPSALLFGPPYRDEFTGIVERFLEAGGGVFVMASVENADMYLVHLIKPWGARIPFERLRETGRFPIPRMRAGEELTFTDNIFATPVSTGVKQIWYPLFDVYNAGMTSPIWVSDEWQVVVRGSKTSYTIPVDTEKTGFAPPEDVFVREEGVKEPVLFAIRSYKKGRIAFCSQWPQFSIGQGTQWLYDRLVLSKGLEGKPSHFGRLIENTLRWLSEPSLKSGEPGGYVTNMERFVHPNDRREIKEQWRDRVWTEGTHDFPERDIWKVYRGLIGAQTSLSSGAGTVEEYARAAKKAGLDFVIFTEDFENLTAAELDQLKSDCKKYSNSELELFPGYTIDSNIGDHMFFYGHGVVLPPENCLIGKKLNLQYQDPKTGEYQLKNPVASWIIKYISVTNAGYYHFSDGPRKQKIPDLRNYSVAAIRFYKNGKLVEDMTEDYLTCAQGTMPPTPVSVNLVQSPQELKREVASGNSLTYAQASSKQNLFRDALSWSHQTANMNVFLSDGPIIRAWPHHYHIRTYGREDFVTGTTRMPALLHVTSDVGLKEILIYNGPDLFRRFLPGGKKEFKEILQLVATIQMNLILIAEDVNGGKAVSFARRCWKDDSEVSFCGDHVNAGAGYLGKGPTCFVVGREPEIFGGYTWDGGPRGIQPLPIFHGWHYPVLESDKGTEGDRDYNNLPRLEFSDESVLKVRSELDQIFDEKIKPPVSPWHTFGPIDPTRLLRATLKYTEFAQPTVGPSQFGWEWQADRKDARTAIFENTITFKKDLKVNRLKLKWTGTHEKPSPVMLVLGTGKDTCEEMDISSPEQAVKGIRIRKGEWFGLYSPETSNSVLIINRGEPFKVEVVHTPPFIMLVIWADLEGKEFKEGENAHYEFLSVADTVDVSVRGQSRFLHLIRYLESPEGFKLIRGERGEESPGLMELKAAKGAVEFRITKPKTPVEFTLPVRINGLNPRWSAGFFQIDGYCLGHYGTGKNRYKPAGIDLDGRAYGALFPDYSAETHVVIGHPVISNRKELFIQVTQKEPGSGGAPWHVSVNNPTNEQITARFTKAMSLPGFEFKDQTRTIPAGGYVVLSE